VARLQMTSINAPGDLGTGRPDIRPTALTPDMA